MPIAPEVAEKAKAQLLAEFLQQHADEINGEASKQQQNSSSSKQQAPKQLSAQEVAKRKQKFEAEFEKRYRVARRIPGGYATFDDAAPDAGCAFEVEHQQPNTSHVPSGYEGTRTITVDSVVHEDPECARLRSVTEQYRETHWKLTAPKGFATLKGIPELQQLLAYTAADVVHYAAESDRLGCADNWPPVVGERERDYGLNHERERGPCHLSNDSSLIGQLCPGLRLCLAAEVATGLMCDSQPPPPDTPEHASALLLFLAAALKQVEQECQPAEYLPGGGSWRLNPSIPGCKTLVDLCACPGIENVLAGPGNMCVSLQDRSSSGGARASASAGGSKLRVLQPSEAGGNVLVAAWALAQPAFEQEQEQQQEEAQTVVFAQLVREAAHMVDAFLQQGVHQEPRSTPASSSSGGCSSSSEGPPPSAAEVAWHAAAVAGGAALSLVLAGPMAAVNAAADSQVGLLELTFAVQLSLLASAVHGLQEAVADALQDAAAHSRQHKTCLAAGHQQHQLQHQRLSRGGQQRHKQQQGSEHAIKQQILMQVLGVVDMGRTFQNILCQQAARNSSTSTAASSRSSSSKSQPQQHHKQQQHQAASEDLSTLQAALAAGEREAWREAGQAAAGSRTALSAVQLLKLQAMEGTRGSPAQLLQHAFEACCGQQQATPLHLHPALLQQLQEQQAAATQQQRKHQQQHLQQGQPPTNDLLAAIDQVLQGASECVRDAAGTAARRAALQGAAGPPGLTSTEAGRQWLSMVNADYRSWCSKQVLLSTGGGSSGGSAAAAAAAASEDRLQQLISVPEHWQQFSEVITPLLEWQHCWAATAAELARAADERDCTVAHSLVLRWQLRRYEREKREEAEKAGKQPAGAQEQQPQQQQGKGKGAKKKQRGGPSGKQAAAAAAGQHKGDGGDSGEEGHGDGDAAAASQRDTQRSTAGEAGEGGSSSRDSKLDQEIAKTSLELQAELAKLALGCTLCAAERAAAPALHSSSSSSSSSSGEGGGLYANLPVSWSDPCLMRRLLWGLLGRLKPAAQQWYQHHAYMCPHRRDVSLWRQLVMSLARHIWAPPGTWGEEGYPEQYEEQLALLLPFAARSSEGSVPDGIHDREAAARQSYARAVNASFARQGPDAQVAAVLSLQALLALDPHGARVQPRPELLLYTPAGFHAAVCKTLMQAVQLTPGGLPAAGSTSSCLGPLAAGSLPKQGRSGDSSLQQQYEQQPQLLADQPQQPHPLQAWTAAAFPAWYVWWHIGLLAYHQQQQESGAGSRRSSSTGRGGGSGVDFTAVDLYSSPEARLFAVGYGARQVSCSSQLERLLSNPPAAPGLAIAPADWLVVPPHRFPCPQCGTEQQCDKGNSICCSRCWSWYCSQACFNCRCFGGCEVEPLVQAKADRRWRVLDLLHQPQQPAPQAPAAGPPEPSEGLHGIPGATNTGLADGVRAALRQHPSAQQQQQQWRQQLGRDCRYVPMFRLYETEPWELQGCNGSAHSGAGAQILRHTTQLARRWSERRDRLGVRGLDDDDNEDLERYAYFGNSYLDAVKGYCRQQQHRLAQQQRSYSQWHEVGAEQQRQAHQPRYGGSLYSRFSNSSSTDTWQQQQQQQEEEVDEDESEPQWASSRPAAAYGPYPPAAAAAAAAATPTLSSEEGEEPAAAAAAAAVGPLKQRHSSPRWDTGRSSRRSSGGSSWGGRASLTLSDGMDPEADLLDPAWVEARLQAVRAQLRKLQRVDPAGEQRQLRRMLQDEEQLFLNLRDEQPWLMQVHQQAQQAHQQSQQAQQLLAAELREVEARKARLQALKQAVQDPSHASSGQPSPGSQAGASDLAEEETFHLLDSPAAGAAGRAHRIRDWALPGQQGSGSWEESDTAEEGFGVLSGGYVGGRGSPLKGYRCLDTEEGEEGPDTPAAAAAATSPGVWSQDGSPTAGGRWSRLVGGVGAAAAAGRSSGWFDDTDATTAGEAAGEADSPSGSSSALQEAARAGGPVGAAAWSLRHQHGAYSSRQHGVQLAGAGMEGTWGSGDSQESSPYPAAAGGAAEWEQQD